MYVVLISRINELMFCNVVLFSCSLAIFSIVNCICIFCVDEFKLYEIETFLCTEQATFFEVSMSGLFSAKLSL